MSIASSVSSAASTAKTGIANIGQRIGNILSGTPSYGRIIPQTPTNLGKTTAPSPGTLVITTSPTPAGQSYTTSGGIVSTPGTPARTGYGGGGYSAPSQPQSVNQATALDVGSNLQQTQATANQTKTISSVNYTLPQNLILQQQYKQQQDLGFQQTQQFGYARNESTLLSQGIRQKSFTPSGRGTTITYNKPYSEKEIINIASAGAVSKTAAIGELQARESAKYGAAYTSAVNNAAQTLFQQGQTQYNQALDSVQNNLSVTRANLIIAVNEGRLSAEQANQQYAAEVNSANSKLTNLSDIINAQANANLTQRAADWTAKQGKQLETESMKYIDRVSDKITFNRIIATSPLIVGAGIATGAVGGVVAGTGVFGAELVTAGGIAATGIVAASAGVGLVSAYSKGTLTPTKVANVIIPAVLFGAGAYGGARLATGGVDSVRLKSAVETSELKTTSIKGITTEAEIRALRIPEADKATLIRQLREGSSVKQIKSTLDNINPSYRAELNKINPEITTYQITTQTGKQIEVGSITQIKTQRGLMPEQKSYIASRGQGQVQGEFSIMDILNIRSQKELPLAEISRTRQLTKSAADNFGINRVVKSQSLTNEIARAVSPTREDIINVLAAEGKGTPIRTAKSVEIQQLKDIDVLGLQQGEQGLFGIQKRFYTKSGAGISEKLSKPVDFEVFYNKGKPFSYDIGKAEKFPEPKVEAGNKAINKLIAEQKKISKVDFSQLDITADIQRAIKAENIKLPQQKMMTINELQIFPKLANIKQFADITEINVNMLKQNMLMKNNLMFAQPDLVKVNAKMNLAQLQVQALSPQQIQKQIAKLSQINANQINPNQINPQFEIPIIPYDFGGFDFGLPGLSGGGAGSQSKKKRKLFAKKFKPQYTASLVAAAFQSNPVRITRAQYKALSEATYTGAETRPVLEIVPDSKTIKKMIRKVNF